MAGCHQADRREGAKSVGLPGSFSLTVAPSTGINMGYSGTAVCTAASLERVVVAREAEAARLARRQQRKGVLCLAGMYSDVPLNLAGELLLLAQQPVAGRCVTHRNAPSVASTPASTALGRRAAQHQPPRAGAAVRRGAGRQLCAGWQHDFQRHGQRGSAARVLPHHAEAEAVPVASDDELAFYRVHGSTASGGRLCEQSWVLGEDGKPLGGESGERQHPQGNEWDLNILMQWLLLMGATDGATRTLPHRCSGCCSWVHSATRTLLQRMLDALLVQPLAFLMPTLAAGVETDGCRDLAANALRIMQGQLCGHETQMGYFSAAALRCGVGGRVVASVSNYHWLMRGVRLRELSALVRVQHKRIPEETAKRKYVRAGIGKTYQCHDSHLRHFRAEQQQGLQVCVRIRLAGGLQLVRTACGAGV